MRRPRSASQASSEPGTAPETVRARRSASATFGSRVTSTPASASECPERNLVAECMTRSAPSSRGRSRMGVAKVLSTTRVAPA